MKPTVEVLGEEERVRRGESCCLCGNGPAGILLTFDGRDVFYLCNENELDRAYDAVHGGFALTWAYAISGTRTFDHPSELGGEEFRRKPPGRSVDALASAVYSACREDRPTPEIRRLAGLLLGEVRR